MRLRLFEWGDQPWFPAPLRAAMTAYLVAAYRVTPFPELWAGRLATLMSRDQVNEIVDLGSGSGGPVDSVMKKLADRGFMTSVTLTDLYPPKLGYQFPGNALVTIRYWQEAVNAASVPPELSGVRTMFASFHHFPPALARCILRDAFEQERAIAIFEATSRSPAAIATTILIPLLVLLLTPRVRPVSWVQIVFTYLVPILPFLIFWDGLVSQLRTYSVPELEELTRDLESPGYRWEVGTVGIPRLPAGVPFLMGRPANEPSGEGSNLANLAK